MRSSQSDAITTTNAVSALAKPELTIQRAVQKSMLQNEIVEVAVPAGKLQEYLDACYPLQAGEGDDDVQVEPWLTEVWGTDGEGHTWRLKFTVALTIYNDDPRYAALREFLNQNCKSYAEHPVTAAQLGVWLDFAEAGQWQVEIRASDSVTGVPMTHVV